MPSPHKQTTTATAKTVLYIEDNLSNIKLVERILASTPQYELVVAMHGELGIDLAKTGRPDLVLLDLNLPDMGGREILARLRAEPATHNTPIVVVSADATSAQTHRLLSEGATGYLTKPINIDEFRQMLRSHLEGPDAGEETVEAVNPTPAVAAAQSDQLPITAEAPHAMVLDDAAVTSLRELFAAPADVQDFLATVDAELFARLEALQEAITRADPSGVRVNAHALRGMLGAIGATQASLLCASLEHDPPQSHDALGEIKVRLDESIEDAQSEIHERLREDR
jgi:CheY-like chemotaxis protein